MKNLKVHNLITFINNKLALKKDAKVVEQDNSDSLRKMIEEKMARKKNACEELRGKIVETVFMRDQDGNETAVPDEVKEDFLNELQAYSESDYIRHVISKEEMEDTVLTEYLAFDSKGLSYGTDMYSIGIDGHFHTHYYEPEEILYRYSLVEKKKQKAKS